MIASRTKIGLIVFIVALTVRLALLAAFWDTLPKWETDEDGYQLLSVGILKNQSFRKPFATPYQPEHLVMPGYPLIMAILYLAGVRPHRVFIMQCFVDALTAALITCMVCRLQGSSRRALFGGMLYALWPAASQFCLRLYVEPLLTFIVALLFFILAGKATGRRLAFRAGLLCAAGLYIKPNFLLLTCIVGFFLFAASALPRHPQRALRSAA